MKRENIWDFWAARYENLWVQEHSLKPTRKLVVGEITGLLEKTVAGPVRLLDIGCGTGQLLEELASLYLREKLELTGIDGSRKMIEIAQKKKISGISFLTGDVHNLPFSEHSFQFITCCHSFPYYRDQAGALKEMARILKPGGSLLLIQAAENSFYDKLIMKMVKCTTGKAVYPSDTAVRALVKRSGLVLEAQKKLAVASFMPSIVLSTAYKGS